jgi:hypothetical protein
MRDRRRNLPGGWTDAIILAAFLGLSVFAYDRLFVGVGDVLAAQSSVEFADFYLPGHNPWAGAATGQQPAASRFATLSRLRRVYH